MEADKIIVLLSGISFSAFIYWYFLAYKEKITTVSGRSITIKVDGGYAPQSIKVKKGTKLTLNFERKDPSTCLEEVVIPDFSKKAFLPLNQTVTVDIEPTKTGEYEFTCGMNMYRGKIIVEE